jgi:hypothetical protein
MVFANALYLAYVVERETVACFLEFQEIRLLLQNLRWSVFHQDN